MSERVIGTYGNPFAGEVTVTDARPNFDWRTGVYHDAIDVSVEKVNFKLDREQALRLAIALINAANRDENFYGACADEHEVADMIAEQMAATDEQFDDYDEFAKYEGISSHFGHD